MCRHGRHSKREQHRKNQSSRWSHDDPLVPSRWRREPNPNPVALTEQDAANQNYHRENKYKPVFLDCSKLNPVVEEEAERGKMKILKCPLLQMKGSLTP